MQPDLYWISGSPPAWRVMLGFTLKGVSFTSRRLDHNAGENRSSDYLALNPKGQVPTVVAGNLVIRESIAILAWLDRAFPDRPIWGETAFGAAQIWQDVMVMEGDLRPLVTEAARSLIRKNSIDQTTIDALSHAMDSYDVRLSQNPYLGGSIPMASDIWLYPALHWIARGVALSSDAPAAIATLVSDRPFLNAWMDRFAALQGVEDTYPPHWRD